MNLKKSMGEFRGRTWKELMIQIFYNFKKENIKIHKCALSSDNASVVNKSSKKPSSRQRGHTLHVLLNN